VIKTDKKWKIEMQPRGVFTVYDKEDRYIDSGAAPLTRDAWKEAVECINKIDELKAYAKKRANELGEARENGDVWARVTEFDAQKLLGILLK